MVDIYGKVVRVRQVRKDVLAIQYNTGNVVINGKIYAMYTFTGAIAKYRKDNPIK